MSGIFAAFENSSIVFYDGTRQAIDPKAEVTLNGLKVLIVDLKTGDLIHLNTSQEDPTKPATVVTATRG